MSVPAAVQISVGAYPGVGSFEPQNVTLNADQDNWVPPNWYSSNHYGLVPSPDNTDRTIGGFLSIRNLSELTEAGNPVGRKKFQVVGDPGDTGIVRVKHDDAGQASSSSRVICPYNKWMVFGTDDSWEMAWWNSRWQVYSVTRAPFSPISPVAIAADQIGWNPPAFARAEVIRMTASGAANLHGLENVGAFTAVDQFLGAFVRKTFVNVSAFPITIKNESATETTAARRFLIPGGDLPVLPNEQFDAFYDDVSAKWRVL